MMNFKSYKTIFSLSATFLTSIGLAHAAECFDKNTDDPKAGNTTAVVGSDVGILNSSASDFQRPDNGADVFSGDQLRTGDSSHLQLKLCDWSTYTLSPNSETHIAEFYEEKRAKRRRLVNYVRGGMKFASGKDTSPGSTEVKIQESGVTMGVRGTNVILAEIDGVIHAFLEGPEIDNSGLSPQGLVEFWTDENKAKIEGSLFHPGFAITIGEDGSVSEPFRPDTGLVNRLYAEFTPTTNSGERQRRRSQPRGRSGPVEESGQRAQEGRPGQRGVERDGRRRRRVTENLPGSPSSVDVEAPIVEPEPVGEPEPDPLSVGDVLPLFKLEEIAAAQAAPNGTIFSVAPGTISTNDGSGAIVQDDIVVLVQIVVDWSTRTIAPQAFGSFIKIDPSVSDPSNLTITDFDFELPDEVRDAWDDVAQGSILFSEGQDALAEFQSGGANLTLRLGENDTATADLSFALSAPDAGGLNYIVESELTNLEIADEPPQLVASELDLGEVTSIDNLIPNEPGFTLFGLERKIDENLTGDPTGRRALVFSQVEVDLDARTIGGGNSFLLVNASVNGGAPGFVRMIQLDQVASFDSGLFDLALYPVSSLTSDPSVTAGQLAVTYDVFLPEQSRGELALIADDEAGEAFYTNTQLGVFEDELIQNPIATIADLDGLDVLPGSFYQGTGDAFSNSTVDPSQFGSGTSEIFLEVDFAERTIGGVNSFVTVDIPAGAVSASQFTDGINAIGFDDAIDGDAGPGIFTLQADQFSGPHIDSGILILREALGFVGDPDTPIPGGQLDFFFGFTDEDANVEGDGLLRGVPLDEPRG